MKKKISIVTPTYNEELNIEECIRQVRNICESLDGYDYEHIIIDNASTDDTVLLVKKTIVNDPHVKLIVNRRNFGHIRSPYYGLMQASGDAVILVVSDLQDPPSLIRDFVNFWEKGHDIVIGVKDKSEESAVMFFVRKIFYSIINRLSETELVKNFTGFGLYDRSIIDALREYPENYPYLRGLVLEFGGNIKKVSYTQPARKRGFTKNNFYTLYDIGMLGITSHSKVPLRLAIFVGFFAAFASLIIGVFYLLAKLFFWNEFQAGVAPLIIGFFFFGAVQLIFVGIIGEYIGLILTKVSNRPIVLEKERINFNE